jgi:phosphatidylglycerophosphate synthase
MAPFDIGAKISILGTPRTRHLWEALVPAIALLGFLLGALVVYLLRARRLGRFRDEEMDDRGMSGLSNRALRHFFAWLMRPLWRGLVLFRVPPDALTTLALGLAIGAGVAAALGRFAIGGWLFLGAGVLDYLDGRVARETGRATRAGAVLDSVIDRYCEAAMLVGLAWYFRGSTTLVAAMLALTGSLFVPYVRARGEAIGVTMKGVGFMQRPERIVLLGFGVALAPIVAALLETSRPRPTYHLAALVLWVLAATSHVTAFRRLVYVLHALGGRALSLLGGNVRAPRVVIASVVATGTDYAVAHQLVGFGALSAPAATATGCLVGGVIAFTSSRYWAFRAARGALAGEAARYAFVSVTSAALNAGTVALLLLIPETAFSFDWLVARTLVFLTWNLPILRGTVFPAQGKSAPSSSTMARRSIPRARVASPPKVAT